MKTLERFLEELTALLTENNEVIVKNYLLQNKEELELPEAIREILPHVVENNSSAIRDILLEFIKNTGAHELEQQLLPQVVDDLTFKRELKVAADQLSKQIQSSGAVEYEMAPILLFAPVEYDDKEEQDLDTKHLPPMPAPSDAPASRLLLVGTAPLPYKENQYDFKLEKIDNKGDCGFLLFEPRDCKGEKARSNACQLLHNNSQDKHVRSLLGQAVFATWTQGIKYLPPNLQGKLRNAPSELKKNEDKIAHCSREEIVKDYLTGYLKDGWATHADICALGEVKGHHLLFFQENKNREGVLEVQCISEYAPRGKPATNILGVFCTVPDEHGNTTHFDRLVPMGDALYKVLNIPVPSAAPAKLPEISEDKKHQDFKIELPDTIDLAVVEGIHPVANYVEQISRGLPNQAVMSNAGMENMRAEILSGLGFSTKKIDVIAIQAVLDMECSIDAVADEEMLLEAPISKAPAVSADMKSSLSKQPDNSPAHPVTASSQRSYEKDYVDKRNNPNDVEKADTEITATICIDKGPEAAAFFMRRSRALFKKGFYQEAIIAAEKAALCDSVWQQYSADLASNARLQMECNDFIQANTLLIEQDNNNAAAYRNRAAAWCNKHYFFEALIDASIALLCKGIEESDIKLSYSIRSDAYCATGQFPKAKADIEALRRMDSKREFQPFCDQFLKAEIIAEEIKNLEKEFYGYREKHKIKKLNSEEMRQLDDCFKQTNAKVLERIELLCELNKRYKHNTFLEKAEVELNRYFDTYFPKNAELNIGSTKIRLTLIRIQYALGKYFPMLQNIGKFMKDFGYEEEAQEFLNGFMIKCRHILGANFQNATASPWPISLWAKAMCLNDEAIIACEAFEEAMRNVELSDETKQELHCALAIVYYHLERFGEALARFDLCTPQQRERPEIQEINLFSHLEEKEKSGKLRTPSPVGKEPLSTKKDEKEVKVNYLTWSDEKLTARKNELECEIPTYELLKDEGNSEAEKNWRVYKQELANINAELVCRQQSHKHSKEKNPGSTDNKKSATLPSFSLATTQPPTPTPFPRSAVAPNQSLGSNVPENLQETPNGHAQCPNP